MSDLVHGYLCPRSQSVCFLVVYLSTSRAREEWQLRAAPRPFRCGQATCFSLVKLLLVAIALFCTGPQSGSLDADRDGTPEVPIIVLSSSSGVILAQDLTKNRPAVVSRISTPLPRLLPNQQARIEKQSNSILAYPTLLSPGLLRC